jgi:hypothetical protein
VQPTIKIHDFLVALGIQGIFGTPPLRYTPNHPTRLVGAVYRPLSVAAIEGYKHHLRPRVHSSSFPV